MIKSRPCQFAVLAILSVGILICACSSNGGGSDGDDGSVTPIGTTDGSGDGAGNAADTTGTAGTTDTAGTATPSGGTASAVSIEDKGDYFAVTLDFSSGLTHKEMGQRYAEAILAKCPTIEKLVDSYLAEYCLGAAHGDVAAAKGIYSGVVAVKLPNVKPQIPQDYRDEIDGMTDICSTGATDTMGDDRLSVNELYAINVILDISKGAACSAFAAFGPASATGNAVAGRVLDWDAGNELQLNQIHAVTTIKNGPKSIVLVGYLGYVAGLSVVSDDKLFAAILESSAATYATAGKYSYAMDLRYAMENLSTIDAVTDYMDDRAYVSGNLVFVADQSTSKVLENDLSTTRTVRSAGAALLPGVEWFASNATLKANTLGAVNSFVLAGKYDRHTAKDANANRWGTMKDRVASAFADGSIDASDVRAIMSAYTGSAPGSSDSGDLYNVGTQQIMVFEPATMTLSAFFAPKDGILPATPTFLSIPVSF